MSGNLIPRATIYEIEAHRARTLSLFAQAFDTVQEAHDAARMAAPSGVFSLPTLQPSGRQWRVGRDELLAETTKVLDRSIWKHLLQSTGLEKLMDRQEVQQFNHQVEQDPPPATAENCLATMERLVGDADLIFKRGIANAFSKLDRRFKSHDGFKIGSRIVLTYAFDLFGSWGRDQDATLRDVERAFCLLDGKEQPERSAGIVGACDEKRRNGRVLERGAWEAESDYFRVKAFKNGNAHVWFKRDDLLERVNLLLADYYGAALGAGHAAAERQHAPSGAVAKNFGLFESPEKVVARIIDDASLWKRDGDPALTLLEPSAGGGNIAHAARDAGALVTCVEIQPHLVDGLRSHGFKTVAGDFLHMIPAALGQFDRVAMNPPFDLGLDVEHVRHAMDFLRPGGKLVAVMSAGVCFREDRKTADFRAYVERFEGRFHDLPALSFAEAGTNVNTVILTLRKPVA